MTAGLQVWLVLQVYLGVVIGHGLARTQEELRREARARDMADLMRRLEEQCANSDGFVRAMSVGLVSISAAFDQMLAGLTRMSASADQCALAMMSLGTAAARTVEGERGERGDTDWTGWSGMALRYVKERQWTLAKLAAGQAWRLLISEAEGMGA